MRCNKGPHRYTKTHQSYNKHLHGKNLENLKETDRFLDTYNLAKLNKDNREYKNNKDLSILPKKHFIAEFYEAFFFSKLILQFCILIFYYMVL